MRTSTFALILALVLLLGCRGARPEAGLPPSAYEGVLPHVVSNDRGFWFLITDGKEAMRPFVVLGEGGDRELFYAVPKGRRTARLMPVTPFAYGLLDQNRGTRIPLSWHDTADGAGADLPDSVGWLSRPDSAPSWAGPTPPDGTPVMLVAGSLTEVPTVARWFVGDAHLKDGKLVSVQYAQGVQGPVVALVDGTKPTRPIRAAIAGIVDVQKAQGVEFSSSSVEVPAAPASTYSTRPAALRAGVDALVSPAVVDGAEITLTRPVLRNGLALAVTEEALTVESEHVSRALLALRDIAAGRDLAASRSLFEIAQGTAARLRVYELVAAAGYIDWTRDSLMREASGLGADVALYLGRSHFVSGDFERAADFATRAEERFADWDEPGRSHGQARAYMLRARLSARTGDWASAFEHSIEAAKRFEAAADSMRAADAELHAANFAANGEDLVKAVKAAALARSRFFHGNSPYHAAFAELALADIYANAGEAGEASKMTQYAVARFEALGDGVGRNRARIVEGRVASTRSRAQAVRDLQIGLEKAQTSGDFVGVVDAAASLVVLGGAPRDATASYGLVIAAGLARTTDPYVRERALNALILLCGRGMADSVDGVAGASPRDIAIAKAACLLPADGAGETNGVAALVTQGWAAWRTGNVEEATSVATKLESAVDDTLKQDAPTDAAEALLLAAVVFRDSDAARADELALRATRLLGDHVDPARLATVLDGLATSYVARGQIWLVGDLLRAAVSAAADQNQTELRRELAVKRVELLHRGGDFDEALAAIYDAQPILETSGASSVAALTELGIVQTDVLMRLGRASDAGVARARAAKALAELEPLDQVRLTLRDAQLAATRGDSASARAALVRATRLEASLADGLVSEASRKLLLARIKLTHADVARSENEAGTAANGYVSALDVVAELPADAATLAFRVSALRGLGLVTTNQERLTQTIDQLEQVRGQAISDFPSVAPAGTAALAALEIEAGRPSRALEVVMATGLDGVAAAENPTEALCIEARAAGMSGVDRAPRLLARCALASRGDAKLDALMLASLVDTAQQSADKNRKARELVAAEPPPSPRLRERLSFVSEIAAGTKKPDDARQKRLEADIEKARERDRAKAVVGAVRALVDYFVQTGQAAKTQPIIEANAGSFYDMGPDGPGALARLRAEASFAALTPVSSFAFASRALAETPDMERDDEAGLLFASAKSAVVLGMWQAARFQLAQARAVARSGGMRKSIDAFARRFSLK